MDTYRFNDGREITVAATATPGVYHYRLDGRLLNQPEVDALIAEFRREKLSESP